MASKQIFITLAIVAVVLPTVSMATTFVVGDDAGWTNTFGDYAAWAKGKEFRVGDTLVFNYPVGAHNVFKVNGTTFKSCAIPPVSEALTTGNDQIILATAGNKWYFCGVGEHCAKGGQKLAITVLPSIYAPAPAPSSASGIVACGFQILGATMISIALMITV